MIREWDRLECVDCGTIWHLPHDGLPPSDDAEWMCPNCRPPAPHCDTCTCHGGD